ncbi:MAG: cyclic nucleotide-binding domain-containing protein [Candidatus Coatesbacteria bacterium]|nr:cyclic nucleotide-binding domain-containing protein [Candidatus Coatesbacteria bacterium]
MSLERAILFKYLRSEELEELQDDIGIVEVKKGEIIFNENDEGSHMFIIDTGEVEILKNIGDDKVVVLAVLDEGQYFGEMAIIDQSKRSATARAVKDSTLRTLSSHVLFDPQKSSPLIANKILRALLEVFAFRLRENNVIVSSLVR